jgi:hypothetical protein
MQRTENDKSPNTPHSHKFTIADDEAVETLISKLETSRAGRVNREKLRQALETAMEEYRGTDETERKAFFHGMLTGYAVALKVEGETPAKKQM